MPFADSHIADSHVDRNARLYLGLYGENAVLKARRREAAFRDDGDLVGADRWRRVAAAIDALLDARPGGPG